MASFESAQDQFVRIGDVRFAYRWLGPTHGVPLVLLMGFRGTMDHWDPTLVNPLAATRAVVLIDNAGVGKSGGEMPKTFTGWAQHYINILRALGVQRADVLGYSMGGCVAQLIALNAPKLVRKLILCGTTPSTGSGVVRAERGPFNQLKAAVTAEEHRKAFLDTFFTSSERSQSAGAAAWERIAKSRKDRSEYVAPEGARRQALAFVKFMNPEEAFDASYNRLGDLKMPVLIASGSEDLLLPTQNSILLWDKLRHADGQLHLYPDSGHGFLYQHAQHFSNLINDFLDLNTSRKSSRL